jgi:hypothetical protein
VGCQQPIDLNILKKEINPFQNVAGRFPFFGGILLYGM